MTTETQPPEAAEAPVDDSVPYAATRSTGEDATDMPAVEQSQNAPQPTRAGDLETSSAPAPSLAGPTNAAPTPTNPPTAPQNPRRKRRAKGWSCPVCRQRKRLRILHFTLFTRIFYIVPLLTDTPSRFFPLAYTSLLRITTTPPTTGGKEAKRVSTSTIDHPLVPPAPTAATGLTGPTSALESTPEEPAVPAPSRSLRPVFLRALTRRTADPVPPV
jgi:hypothetical protein